MKGIIKRILQRDRMLLEFGEMDYEEFAIREKVLREILVELGDEYE